MVHDIITSTKAQTNDRESLRSKIQQHFEKPSNSDIDTNIDFYQFEKEIGKGSFGKVCRIIRKADNKILVWKELNYGKMKEKEKQQLVSEVNILRELNHPNIVKYYDRIIDKANARIYIIMEYCEGGDLAQIIKRCRKQQDQIAEDVIWKILTQITMALY